VREVPLGDREFDIFGLPGGESAVDVRADEGKGVDESVVSASLGSGIGGSEVRVQALATLGGSHERFATAVGYGDISVVTLEQSDGDSAELVGERRTIGTVEGKVAHANVAGDGSFTLRWRGKAGETQDSRYPGVPLFPGLDMPGGRLIAVSIPPRLIFVSTAERSRPPLDELIKALMISDG
jgi:hypothetical protein